MGTPFASFRSETKEGTMNRKTSIECRNIILTVALYQQLLEQAEELARKTQARLLTLQAPNQKPGPIEKR